jgi:hypothetical protein
MLKYIYALSFILIISGCSQKDIKYSVVKEDTKYGVIDQTGYVVVKPIYKHVFNFYGDNPTFEHPHLINLHWIHNKNTTAYAIVENINGKFGIIDQKGKLLLKPIYDSITYFFDGFARIEAGGKFGLIDRNFNIVLKPTYDDIREFIGNIAIVNHKEKFGCINRDMDLKIKPIYDKIFFQQEDFLRTYIDNKWGYLDNECNTLTKAIYDYGYDFSNGIAKVILDEKIGYINSDGKQITKSIFTKQSDPF